MSGPGRLVALALACGALAVGAALVLDPFAAGADEVPPVALPDAPAVELPDPGPGELPDARPQDVPESTEPPRRLRGRVLRRADRTALADVRVTLLADEAPPPSETVVPVRVTGANLDEPVDGLAEARTGRDGLCEIAEFVPEARSMRLAWRPVYPALYQGNEWVERVPVPYVVSIVPLPLHAWSGDIFDVLLDTGWILSGYVDDGRGEPLEGAFVSVDERLPQSVTGRDGRYRVLDIPRTMVPVRIGGWAPDRVGRTVEKPCPPPDVWTLDVDLTLPCAGVLEGVVTDARNAVVAGAEVWALVMQDATASGRHGAPFVVTGPDGRFRIEGLPLGSLDVACRTRPERAPPGGSTSAPDLFTTVVRDVTLVAEHPAFLPIRLEEPAPLQGVVTSSNGKPLDGQRVELWVVVERSGLAPLTYLVGSSESDEDGAFRFPAVASQPHVVVVRSMVGWPFRHEDRVRSGSSWREPWTEEPHAVTWVQACTVDPAVDGGRAPLQVVVLPTTSLEIVGREPGWGPSDKRVRTALDLLPPKGPFRIVWSSPYQHNVARKGEHVLDEGPFGQLARLTSEGRLSVVTPILLGPAGTSAARRLDVEMPRAPGLEVVVADAVTRDVLSDVSMRVHERGGGLYDTVEDRTHPLGRFAFHVTRAGGSFVLTVTAPGYKRYRIDLAAPEVRERLDEWPILLERLQ